MRPPRPNRREPSPRTKVTALVEGLPSDPVSVREILHGLELPNTRTDALDFVENPEFAESDRLSSAAAIALLAPERMDELGITGMKDRVIEMIRERGSLSATGMARLIWPEIDWNSIRQEGVRNNPAEHVMQMDFERIAEADYAHWMGNFLRGDPKQFRARMRSDKQLRDRVARLIQEAQEKTESIIPQNLWTVLGAVAGARFLHESPTHQLLSPAQVRFAYDDLWKRDFSLEHEGVALAGLRNFYIATAQAVYIGNDGTIILIEGSQKTDEMPPSLPDRNHI